MKNLGETLIAFIHAGADLAGDVATTKSVNGRLMVTDVTAVPWASSNPRCFLCVVGKLGTFAFAVPAEEKPGLAIVTKHSNHLRQPRPYNN